MFVYDLDYCFLNLECRVPSVKCRVSCTKLSLWYDAGTRDMEPGTYYYTANLQYF